MFEFAPNITIIGVKYEKFPFKIEKQFRLPGHDYSSYGYYFITICTLNHENFFGEIKNKNVELNQIGKIAFQYWIDIPNHFRNIRIDEFIIMSNHIHGILIIKNKINLSNSNSMNCRNMPWHVPTDNYNKFSKPVSNSISMVINHFKGSITRFCNQNNQIFHWQPRFHDHIIRTENEYFAIKQYIKDNPKNWENNNIM